MSLIELLIAMMVLMFGVISISSLIMLAIGTNFRSRQESNSTAAAQMVMEKIMSVPASAPQVLTITDCAGTVSNVNTAGSGGGTGASLNGSGGADFTAASVAGYSMIYATCGNTAGERSMYDIRWNIKSVSSYDNIVTVSAKLRGTTNNPRVFSLPVTIRSMSGQGS